MRGMLVGYGSIGRRHMANLHHLGVTDWAVIHTGMGTLPLEPVCPVRVYSDLHQALDAESPTFAVIANPTSLHVATALACIDAGCAVLLEKPVSQSIDGVSRLAASAEEHSARVLVGFQFRFHVALARIREILRNADLGTPLHARVIWAEHLPSWHPWEDWRNGYAARPDLGGGVHHTICHPFDYLRMLFGEPSAVLATLTERGPLGLAVPEAADVVLHFLDGMTAQLHLDYWGRPPMHRMEIICSAGTVEWDYMSGCLRFWDAAEEDWQIEFLPGVTERNDLFMTEARHFLDVVGGIAAPTCTLDDGVAVVRICEAIDRSARSGAVSVLAPPPDPSSSHESSQPHGALA